MIRIGICEDDRRDQNLLRGLCERCFAENQIDHELTLFPSGEAVVAYCGDARSERIDLLFLDIEMPGMSGIEVKDRLVREERIWRIVFVSSYKEKVFESFGLKTLGFVIKPAGQQEISKWIGLVHQELCEETCLELKDSSREPGQLARLEDVEYAKAEGNYTYIYLHSPPGEDARHILLLRKLGELEKEWGRYPIVRVHKSYMVNLMNVTSLGQAVRLRDLTEEIPVGRVYRETVRKSYMEYGKEQMRKRL